jgi:formylglycine-generating enzyme required for sulfatase activity
MNYGSRRLSARAVPSSVSGSVNTGFCPLDQATVPLTRHGIVMNLQRSNDSDRTILAPAVVNPNALAPGTRLGEFEIVHVIGQGGFGIVYFAKDHSLGRDVALKEYMPVAFAGRQGNTQVTMLSEHYAETFQIGLHSFVNEAQLLAKFDHPGLVKVYRFWEANGTGYMAMPFYDAPTLKQMLKEDKARLSSEDGIKSLLRHVLDALQLLHEKQCYHRDIAPDNILMLAFDHPLLLDFGAARRVIGDMTQALTVILKPGYAPIEQYGDVPNMTQGPWTDLYALASVVYFIITDKVPVPALSRLVYDTMVPLAVSEAGRFSPEFLSAIDAALAVRPEQRPQNVGEFRALLGFDAAPQPDLPRPRPAAAGQPGVAAPAPAQRPAWFRRLPRLQGKAALFAAGGGALLVLLAGAAWIMPRPAPPGPTPAAIAATVAAPAASPLALAAAHAPACPLKLADGSPGCPTMVAIPGGSYRVGSSAGDPGMAPEELGGTASTIAPFDISAREVTVGQWQLCVADGACPAQPGPAPAPGTAPGAAPDPGAARMPLVNVSWDAAMAYVGWLSKKTGRGYRLPSEAEWEYAARAGTSSVFPWGDKIGADNAHCGQCGSHLDYRKIAPGASFKPHGGLYDMAGNVYEWVSDCWYPNHADAARAARAPDAACKTKVQKGGAFDSMEADVRPAARTFGERAAADPRVGFRVSR